MRPQNTLLGGALLFLTSCTGATVPPEPPTAPAQAPAETSTREVVAPSEVPPMDDETIARLASTPIEAFERAPRLVVDDAGNPRPMIVASVDTSVVIHGLLAETTTRMVFRNPHGRVMEGELDFPLPEGATISGFGLDVEGQLVEGVVVEKDEARVAFETEVRRGVDPGLAEWVRGNNFKTRVYPIPANGTREIMVRYVHPIAGTSDEAIYHLPLRYPHPIPRFSLEVAVVRGTVKPVATGPLANFSFEQWEDRWVASATQENAQLDEDIRIAVPDMPERFVQVEQDGDDHVFIIHDTIETLPEASDRFQPTRAQVVWDASLSRTGENSAEVELVAGLFQQWPGLTVDFVALRDQADPSVSVSSEAELRALLQELVYDGGTDLSAVPDAPDADLRLLFTDGMGNIGERPEPNAPLFTVAASSAANHLMLRNIAENSGASHINLSTMTAEQGLQQLRPEPYSFIGLEVTSGEVTEVYPQRRALSPGRLAVSGRLASPSAEVALLYGQGTTVQQKIPLQINTDEASKTGLAPRFWAQQRVNLLSAAAEPDRPQLLALGRRYGIVTPGASLLVLENLEQHIEHNVRPPASRPALRQAWDAHQATLTRQKEETQASHLERVVSLWEERVLWWETPVSKNQRPGAGAGSTSGTQRSGFASESAPAASPAPEPAASTSSSGARREMAQMDEEEPMEMEEAASPPPNATSAGGEGQVSGGAKISVQPWDPATPYLAALEAAAAGGKAYEAYLLQRPGYQGSPAYFLDCAGWFYQNGEPELGRRILTAVLDLKIDAAPLLRVVAYRLAETDDLDLAVTLLRKVRELRPEEPQSRRDLALMLARRGERGADARPPEDTAADLSEAMALLHEVTLTPWERFPEVELIALLELNRLLVVSERMPQPVRSRVQEPALDPRLVKNLALDVRISLSWDADLTDIDLWVIEPTREKAYYSNRDTAIGGHVSRDVTNGYGPEEYILREAPAGAYNIQANYYGSSAQSIIGPTTVKAVVYTNWGQPDEQVQELTLRLDQVSDVVDVGTISF